MGQPIYFKPQEEYQSILQSCIDDGSMFIERVAVHGSNIYALFSTKDSYTFWRQHHNGDVVLTFTETENNSYSLRHTYDPNVPPKTISVAGYVTFIGEVFCKCKRQNRSLQDHLAEINVQ